MNTCVMCGIEFTPKRNARYCSGKCGAKASVDRRRGSGTFVHRRKLTERHCDTCDTLFLARAGAKYCTKRCSLTNAQPLATRAASDARRKSTALVLFGGTPIVRQPPITWVRTKNRLTSGQCKVCTTWFVSFHTEITCSPECWTIHNRIVRQLCHDRRRARKRDAFVAVVYRKKIFERDGYRCHLCGKKTNKGKQVPHPKAPTIDHVIPLAAGGTHEPSNCRTACFLCNSSKGAGGGGEQLLLIA